jgi:hypothetical protein
MKSAKAQGTHIAQEGAFGFADGQALAVQLLHELEECDLEVSHFSLDSAEREPGQPQVNVVLRYLDAMKRGAMTGRLMEEGFASVLSDYLAACGKGSIRDASWYDRLVDHRIGA